jgi:hypothetical protein
MMLSMSQLPPRVGPRPRTTETNPHSQLDQHPAPELVSELARGLFSLAGVGEAPSAISVPGARAAWLDPKLARGPREAFLIGTEFAHIHPVPDGSLHAALPSELAKAAVATGWAEVHPVARRGLMPMNVVMLYAPRDHTELEVILALLAAAHQFALGESGPAG